MHQYVEIILQLPTNSLWMRVFTVKFPSFHKNLMIMQGHVFFAVTRN